MCKESNCGCNIRRGPQGPKGIDGTSGTNGANGTLFNLPIPKVWIGKGAFDLDATKEINLFDQSTGGSFGTATLHRIPYVNAQDISQEQIDKNVWVEMLFYKRKTSSKRHGDRHVTNIISTDYATPFTVDGEYTVNTIGDGTGLTLLVTIVEGEIVNTVIVTPGINYVTESVTVLGTELGGTSPANDVLYEIEIYSYVTTKAGYVVPSPWVDGVNTLVAEIGTAIKTRGGTLPLISADRPNHYKLTKPNENIPVWEYLHNRFKPLDITYNNDLNPENTSAVTCIIPVSRSSYGKKFGKRFGYASQYTPLYIAFRYLMWDPTANDGKGDFISGPLSRVVKITALFHPFIQNYIATTHATCEINPLFTSNSTHLKCTIETKLP